MLELRKKLANYQEIFYMLFLLPMTGMTSMGLNSEDRIYLYVFAVATLFLLLKMAVTDFTWREIVIMGVFTLLLGANFLRNGEKTLILTAMGIFGAKNVNLDKVMKYALWEKAVLTVGTLTLVMAGVIENVGIWLIKGDDYLEIKSYGYHTPNMAYANIFVILLLAIVIYREKIKWYVYVVATIVLYGAYKILICRTGFLLWGVLCVAILVYRIAKRFQWQKLYAMFFIPIPAVLAVVTMIIPVIAQKNEEFSIWINRLLTGRITLVNFVYDEVWTLVLGHMPQESYDSIYFPYLIQLWVDNIDSVFGCDTAGMWYCNVKGQYYITIALGVMAVYGYVELLPLSVLWNLPMLYLAQILFKERTVVHE